MHKLETSRNARPTNKPAQGVFVLYKVPNKKTRLWGVITQVNNSTFGGKTYNVTHIGTGKNYTIQEKQIVRCGEPGEKFNFTHK